MAARAKGQTLVASRTPDEKTEQQQQIDPIFLHFFPLLHTDTSNTIQTNLNMRPEVVKNYIHTENKILHLFAMDLNTLSANIFRS